ncbi:unnamed protein product [Ambrosiozyma monospora]|uniref:Unnamed protein product n=1 Tax=Ambrosiozyma monospora TaxID=43982 RepID=A0A9W6YTL1_AMBMO|nr:unnamed protein product [Ambrosiozyma monospora]
MPFKLTLELGSGDAKKLWTRSIFSLSTISDNIKLTIRQKPEDEIDVPEGEPASFDEILLTAVNLSKTTSLTCLFRSNFFTSFAIEGELPNDKPAGDDLNNARSFGFMINSKNLNVLFKDCGENSDHFKMVVIYGEHRQDFRKNMLFRYSNKLYVEFKTKNELLKKYSLNFNNASRDSYDLKVWSEYRRILTLQQPFDDDDDQDVVENLEGTDGQRVRYLAMDVLIFKKLLQLYSNYIEDFKIEIREKVAKLIFGGFNRTDLLTGPGAPGTGKSNHLKTQQRDLISNNCVTLSATLSLSDIYYSNIEEPKDPEAPEHIVQVSFKLKDFKTYINLISFNVSNKQSDAFALTENAVEIMFTTPGFPIVFERKFGPKSGLRLSDKKKSYTADSISAMNGDSDDNDEEYCSFTLTIITDSEVEKLQLQREEKFKMKNMQRANVYRQNHPEIKQESNRIELDNSKLALSQPRAASNVNNLILGEEPDMISSGAIRKLEDEITKATTNSRAPTQRQTQKRDATKQSLHKDDDHELLYDMGEPEEPVYHDEPLFVPDDDGEDDYATADKRIASRGIPGVVTAASHTNAPDEHNVEDILWNNPMYHKTKINTVLGSLAGSADSNKRRKTSDGTQHGKDMVDLDKQDNEEDEVEEEEEEINEKSVYLGPTQNVPRVKGIFDD